MAELFRKHLQQVEDWMGNQPDLYYMDVDYNQILKDPRPQVDKINQFLGGELNTEAMASVVDPQLYRQRR